MSTAPKSQVLHLAEMVGYQEKKTPNPLSSAEQKFYLVWTEDWI